MSNHNGNANKMVSDTPRTDEFIAESCAWPPVPIRLWPDFARQLERELNAANQRIKELEKATQERDKEWFQVIESILGFHPVSMTEALRIGIERVKKQKQRIKRLEEAGDALKAAGYFGGFGDAVNKWNKAKEDKP